MLDILIVENNFRKIKDIVNANLGHEMSKISAVASDNMEAIEILNKKAFDIIILDQTIIDCEKNHILKCINKNHAKQYHKSIVVVYENLQTHEYLNENFGDYIYDVVKISKGVDPVAKVVDELSIKKSENKKDILKYKILQELKYLGYNLSYTGTRYILDIIMIMFENGDAFNTNIRKNIYPILSEKYNKTENAIKANINKATELMYFECEEDKLKEYCGTAMEDKPRPKLVMNAVLAKIEKASTL